MEVVCAERRITLWTLALARLVARAQALETEDMETLREDGVLLLHLARGTCQLFLREKIHVTITEDY